MLRDILRGLVAAQDDMHVVAEYAELEPLLEPVEDHQADVVLFGEGSPHLTTECREVLAARPDVKLFVIAGEGRRTTLYELRPHREPLGEVAPDEFLSAIRAAVQTSNGWVA